MNEDVFRAINDLHKRISELENGLNLRLKLVEEKLGVVAD